MLSQIFKAYDVRGIYGENLTDDIAYKIGRAFVSFLKCKDVVIGYDMRVSSPKLSRAFMKGVNDEGADAIDIGQVSTDGLYFGLGIFFPSAFATSSHTFLATSSSSRALSGVSPKAEQYFKSGISAM